MNDLSHILQSIEDHYQGDPLVSVLVSKDPAIGLHAEICLETSRFQFVHLRSTSINYGGYDYMGREDLVSISVITDEIADLSNDKNQSIHIIFSGGSNLLLGTSMETQIIVTKDTTTESTL
jgi:hypothetical protein